MNRNELSPDASPRAAFGARLRSLRDAHSWTLDDLSARIEYSASHISGVENAKREPTIKFAERADRAFGLTGTRETLASDVFRIRGGSLLEGFSEYVTCEARAAEVRLFETGVIPGLLQTEEYANALAQSAVQRGIITPEQARERVAVVADRQNVLRRTPPPLVMAVLDESCVRRPIGTDAQWDAQLARLLEFAEQPGTVLQLAPFTMGVRRTFDLPLYVLTMPDRSIVAYAESATRGHLQRDGRVVAAILGTYYQLQAEALPQAASAATINALRKGTP
ncbi:helix-turn-helix domain-containing protein [Streptomyces subrutilus]|uniref:Transcriptional regulator n=1 Tax=Streptomyces subrutilus TaxID=36818 RepID=A0A5P2US66_9ACTN|nr:helix-turn-helix transcriptional regulator [Streptomyces subrutilus]QEU80451.1 XRE family transcriptional regulator [Streptomyces subrutilus]WSJ30253.1 helix-turn-helix transcriptional regulator [Streptomyces subrutilus]GGZ75391.1 transcriptional regulator [Streptomyces subrutilus]